MHKYYFFSFFLFAIITSCSPDYLRYNIKGNVPNTNHFQYAYLYVEKDRKGINSSGPCYDDSNLHVELSECSLTNNSFHFKGKTAKDKNRPFTFAMIFLDSLTSISSERAKMKSKYDHKEIILNDKNIDVSISNNLSLDNAKVKGCKFLESYNLALTKLVSTRYTDQDISAFMDFIKTNPKSNASLFLVQTYTCIYNIIPIDSLKLSATYLSPKLKKTPIYESIQKRLSWAEKQLEIDELYEKRGLK